MTSPFFYEALPMRVSFGAGYRSKLADEVNKLGLKRVLVLATEFQKDLAQEISNSLGELLLGLGGEDEDAFKAQFVDFVGQL
jgi:maleylacetate reductase